MDFLCNLNFLPAGATFYLQACCQDFQVTSFNRVKVVLFYSAKRDGSS